MCDMTPKKQFYENVANTIIKNLEKRQMEGFYCPDCESAGKKALELMPEGASIGWGGSMTLNEMGLMDAIRKKSFCSLHHLPFQKTTLTHNQNSTKERVRQSRRFCRL